MKFSAISGRQKVKDRLIRMVTEGRIPHAMLFGGPSGNDALPFALAFAAYIQCTNRSEHDSCGTCPACVKNNKLVHPDLHFTFPVATIRKLKNPTSLDFLPDWRAAVLSNPNMSINDWYDHLKMENKQGYMPVEESMDVIKRLSLKSFESAFKIQIVWQADKMRKDAANKLLKIMEEPPPNTIFIIISDHSELLLATILSRTQLIRIPRLNKAELIQELELNGSVNAKMARKIAGLSAGDLNVALSMAKEQDLETGMEAQFIDWMRLCFSPFRTYKPLVEWVDEMAGSGREYQKQFLVFFLEVVRECLLTNQEVSSLVHFDDEVMPSFSKFSPFIHSGNAGELENIVNQAHYAIGRNANPKILFLDLSFKISRLIHQPK